MDNALWLMGALPDWYFSPVLAVFANPELLGSMFVVPIIGTLSLTVGIGWAVFRPHRGLWLVLVPVVLSEALVGAAGWFRGQMPSGGEWVLLPFLGIVLVMAGVLVWRSPGSRGPAVLLGLFALTYALFAGFIAGMAFPDVWM